MLQLDIRCGHCQRKLATGRYLELQIKCPRCGTLNYLKAESLTPERHRASEFGDDDEQSNSSGGGQPGSLDTGQRNPLARQR